MPTTVSSGRQVIIEPVSYTHLDVYKRQPSVVAFVDGGERKIGDPAKRQAIRCV